MYELGFDVDHIEQIGEVGGCDVDFGVEGCEVWVDVDVVGV